MNHTFNCIANVVRQLKRHYLSGFSRLSMNFHPKHNNSLQTTTLEVNYLSFLCLFARLRNILFNVNGIKERIKAIFCLFSNFLHVLRHSVAFFINRFRRLIHLIIPMEWRSAAYVMRERYTKINTIKHDLAARRCVTLLISRVFIRFYAKKVY